MRVGAVLKARGVAQKHLDVGEKPVGDEDGFGALQVGVGGHGGFAGGGCLREERLAPTRRVDSMSELDARTNVEPEVGGDLLVAAAAGVELEGEVADAGAELQLDEVVDVFGVGVVANPGNSAELGIEELRPDAVESLADGRDFGLR